MDRRKLVAAIVERTGVKLDPDDPAFLLVELNHLMLESEAGKVAGQIELAGDKLNQATTRSLDEFVAVANETVSKFKQQTDQIRIALEGMQIPAAGQAQIAPHAATKNEASNAHQWWFSPVVFAAGVMVGALLSYLALK